MASGQPADVLTRGLVYHEVTPQLVPMAFLQGVVNGGVNYRPTRHWRA